MAVPSANHMLLTLTAVERRALHFRIPAHAEHRCRPASDRGGLSVEDAPLAAVPAAPQPTG
jgi:hypothetical protein